MYISKLPCLFCNYRQTVFIARVRSSRAQSNYVELYTGMAHSVGSDVNSDELAVIVVHLAGGNVQNSRFNVQLRWLNICL